MDAEGEAPPAVVLQQNLPEALQGRAYFQPGKQGEEARLRAWIEARRGSNDEDPFAE
jgi:putative ATPase